ncbi:aldo/keto reductase [Parenemella sanctibonifatiensis]|uniref:Aldo/keto reductase n=1 Tax=Parenemella sanctibonifatiensis TaxID=2016505 RepID=A0A255ELV8_9ACTN|nr:aldo/keto reductase [Parenemella sanctibonifatiensis]OYN90442.1 aldo/keto reductase [Parenemella sanctibonifatiensis]
MDLRPLARTGVKVSPLCLGAMMFGPIGNDDRADAIRIIHAALDAGINFIDTSDSYSKGVSEEIVGEALQGRRDDVVLATKFYSAMDKDPNHRGGSRRWIMREVEDSLRRLGTDHIDLYQMHRPDPDTDIEETLGALTDLVRQGKVRYIGTSSFSGSQIVEAQWVSKERRLERFVTEQPPYSLLVRGIETDVLPTLLRHGMTSLVYSPLSGGWLSGKWGKDNPPQPASKGRPAFRFDMANPANQRKLEMVDDLSALAADLDITLTELAIAFVIRHPGVTSAIIGPRTMEQLETVLPAVNVELSNETLDRIDEIVAPGLTVSLADHSYGEQELKPERRRR